MAKKKKPTLIWNNAKFIGEVRKSDRKKVTVELTARDGVKYVNLREWYLRKKDKEWKPSLKGMAIPIKLPIDGDVKDIAAELLTLMERTIEESADFAIEDPEHAVYVEPK